MPRVDYTTKQTLPRHRRSVSVSPLGLDELNSGAGDPNVSASTSATPLVLKPTTTTTADFHSTLVPLFATTPMRTRHALFFLPQRLSSSDFCKLIYVARISALYTTQPLASTFASRIPLEIRVPEQYKCLRDDRTQPYLNFRLPKFHSPCRSAQDYEHPTKNDSTHCITTTSYPRLSPRQYDSALYFAESTPPRTSGRKTDGNIV
ncbi:hypothetical protein C8F04DRAFT_1186271 [Mycena alexandri]|uniref:Uncharacterized protein n=1 Tax=Mycena alexandri TaxID=1745969 RepID=A0AAD6SR30_9AGAR|nr:hypothetical protein C8F04DRAFT_1186271 [Mycena alexandri]